MIDTATSVCDDRFFWTADNVRIHYRDYAGTHDKRPALLCLPGLTRNSRDFDQLAQYFAPTFRVVTTSLRGRGESGYARDPLTYVPLTYIRDLGLLMDEAKLDKVIVIGTSLGGVIALLLDATQKQRIAGLVLNDIGPDMEAEGLRRLREQLGRNAQWPSWLICARDLARRHKALHPNWTLEDWLAHAKRLCRISREGRIILDYDPQIAAPFDLPNTNNTTGALDLWLALAAYRNRPVLSLRGELSDILSDKGQQQMQSYLPHMQVVTIPQVGHAPTLTEPEALAALEAFLQPFL